MNKLTRIFKKIPKTKKTYITISFLALLVVARMALPTIIKGYLNDYLENDMETYTGHIEDFDLSIWRGAYQIQDFTLKRKTSKEATPFFDLKEADISLSWAALFRGKFLVDLTIREPKVNFTDSKEKENKQLGVEAKKETWKDLLNELVPFNLESLKITKGEIHFLNTELKAPLDLYLKEIELLAQNIHNSKKQDDALFSSYEIKAVAQNQAPLYSKGSFNILQDPIDFDINFKLEKLNLTKLNTFLKSYGPLDLTSGEFNFYMEVASKDGNLKGYLKPMFKNMDVRAGAKEIDNSLKEFGFEIITAVVNVILKNSDSKSLATKIPLEGNMKNPKLDIWKGIRVAIDNGFGKPEVEPKIDNEISLKSVPKQDKKKNK